MHKDLKKAIEESDLDVIESFLNTAHYESDSETTCKRSYQAFKRGWEECQKHGLKKSNFEIGDNLSGTIIWSMFWLAAACIGLGGGQLFALTFGA